MPVIVGFSGYPWPCFKNDGFTSWSNHQRQQQDSHTDKWDFSSSIGELLPCCDSVIICVPALVQSLPLHEHAACSFARCSCLTSYLFAELLQAFFLEPIMVRSTPVAC